MSSIGIYINANNTIINTVYFKLQPLFHHHFSLTGRSTDTFMFCVLFTVKIEIPQSVTWIKVNYNQKGYYRVNYDEQNWKKLIELMKNNLTVRTAS